MSGVPRPVRCALIVAAGLFLYAIADATISALVHANGSDSSWGAVSAFTAMISASVLLGSLIPLSLLLERRQAAAGSKHPDYAAIAAMEREVYGETFRHEGAADPYDSSMYPSAALAPPPKCYCNWCRGRAGVHGAEAKALYQAEVAAVMAQHDEHRSNLRWERPS